MQNDKFYDWTSSFMHANWAVVSDSTFDLCGNPLHRLHLIPSERPSLLPTVIVDAVSLTDAILDELSALYPDFADRLLIRLAPATQAEEGAP